MSPSKEPNLYDLTALCATPNATLAGIFFVPERAGQCQNRPSVPIMRQKAVRSRPS